MPRPASPLPLPKSLTPATALEQARTLLQRGQLNEAEKLYEFVLKGDHNNFVALQNLAVVRIQQGRFEDAVTLLRRALNRDPNSAEAHSNLGNALLKLDRPQEAVARYEKALVLRPGRPETHTNLGIALQLLGRDAEAIAHFEKALAPDPGDADAQYKFARTMIKAGYCERAVDDLENVLALRPDFAPAFKDLGYALQDLGRFAEARQAYERAIALKPDYADAFYDLGIMLAISGRTAEAEQVMARAIEINPSKPTYYHGIGTFKRFRPGDAHLAAMEKLAGGMASLPAADQMHLHFALGKALEDCGEHERSFRHLLEANAFKRRTITYNEASLRQTFERCRKLVSPALMRERAGCGHPSAVPIFIVGMPRSGTTLIEQILASHPSVFGAGERRDFLRAIHRHLPGFPRPTVADMGTALRELGGDYVEHITALAPNAARITDKMPSNFQFLGLIHLTMPNARIIHVRRDPVDTCISIFYRFFWDDQPFAYDLGELGRYYRMYDRLMQHWREIMPAGAMIEVQYEDVVADLEGQAQRIVAYCGLDWDDSCLAFHKTERPIRTASVNQVRQPIYGSSVGRGRRYGDMLGPLLEALGDPPDQYDELKNQLMRALAATPNDANVHSNLGMSFIEKGRPAEAVPCFEKAIAIHPDFAVAHGNLGVALMELGRIDEARRAIEKAIVLTPRRADLYLTLADCKRFSRGDPHLAAMMDMARGIASLPQDAQINLHFALGKALADIGEHQRSFHYLLEGNAQKRRKTLYDESAVLGTMARIRETFTSALMRAKVGHGEPSAVPIFILGMPRSGTTLIEQILASHPRIFGAGELTDFGSGVRETVTPFPDGAAAMTDASLRRLGTRYLESIVAKAPSAVRITDKLPANFYFAGLIHLALPNARIIHVRRDPMDTCTSIFSTLFSAEMRFAYDLGEIGRYYRAYEELMAHWREVMPEGAMLEVQYEDVVADLEGQARRIIAFCGLEWDDACLAFHKTARAVRTASKTQVRQPIYASSVGRWRRYGKMLAPLFEALEIELPAESA